MSDPGTMNFPAEAGRWGVFEVVLSGPDEGNPFTDVELAARFERTEGEAGDVLVAGGFYDGDGRYLIRFSPDELGGWTFSTTSSTPALDGLTGSFVCGPAEPGNHGPVRVADTYHFRYADGTRYLPLGTTSYAWTHQSESLQDVTVATLAGSPFTKIRMGVFPKHYLYNSNEPELFPFVGDLRRGFDTTRPEPEFFRRLERRIASLAELGIEADMIIFHPYDRWGFANLGADTDDFYVRYLVRRLSAYRNVWWSMANEFDLIPTKSIADWERLAAIVQDNDPHDHLRSIHNCLEFYDHSRPWITHSSLQRVDVYRTAENTDEWRQRWGKPAVIDECGYEGDIDQGWGNITGEELTRRFWEGAMRGGYVGHGETYLNDREELWWSKGGSLVGTSPARIAFLKKIISEAPGGVLEPLPGDWDLPYAGVADEHVVAYFGFNRPRFRWFTMPPGRSYSVEVIDTWDMTVERRTGSHAERFRVDLPGRPYCAVRLIAQPGE